jgi:hypothetical protein
MALYASGSAEFVKEIKSAAEIVDELTVNIR